MLKYKVIVTYKHSLLIFFFNFTNQLDENRDVFNLAAKGILQIFTFRITSRQKHLKAILEDKSHRR